MDPLAQAKALFHQALTAQECKDFSEAERLLRQALIYAPGRESLLANLAGVLLETGQTGESAELCEQVLTNSPENATAWLNLALCRMHEDAPETALGAVLQAIRLDPENAAAHGNHGSILMLLGRPEEALPAFEQALRLDQRHAGWHTARGTALRAMRRFDEAAEAHTQAIRLDPECTNAHWNLGLVELTRGNFAAGWQGFEWRWRTPDPVIFSYRGHAPRWHGEPLAGRNILLWSEQGLGDTLQFCRFALTLAEQGAQVILQVQPPLVRLLHESLSPHQIRVIAQGEIPPPHDVHSPLLSLPLVLGTRAENIPARSQAYLQAPARLADNWQARLEPRQRPRIGLMWQGNLENRIGRSRSLPVEQLLPLLKLPCDFFFAGKDLDEAGAQTLCGAGNFRHFTDSITDFADTASLISQLDLVISIDTSVAHLSAALGIPTWVLLARGADWRWGQNDESSPWYRHSTRLFRQRTSGDWGEVIEAVHAALQAQG